MNESKIEWCDMTWNCIRGCTRVSEGCRRCYAEQIAGRFSDEGQAFHGYATRKLVVLDDDHQRHEARWTGKVDLIASALAAPLRIRKPRRIFVNSMADLFHESLTNEQIAAVFGVMAACPQHTFQVLTKRAQRMAEWFEWAREGGDPVGKCYFAAKRLAPGRDAERVAGKIGMAGEWTVSWPLPNVWIGVSVENQWVANERIPWLTRVPAAMHFLSCEPLIGPIDLKWVSDGCFNPGWLDWVIVGCETGIGSRACLLSWVRSLRDQCEVAGVSVFVKQLEACDETTVAPDEYPDPIVTVGGGRLVAVVAGEPRQHKRIAGRDVVSVPFLDGRQHNAFPKARREYVR